MDDGGLISVRSREIKLRKLDAEKLIHQKTNFQILNVVLPIVLVALLAAVILILRRRKFAK